MSLKIMNEVPPLEIDKDEVVHVGGTRITLDTVVLAFKDGATAEEIVYQYPTLSLADVYAVIGYYLKNNKEIENYLSQRKKVIDKVYNENKRRFKQDDIRERLIARQNKMKK